jgi:hypothetical protein
MQENGKLFSFLAIACLFLMSLTLKSDNARHRSYAESYCVDRVENSVQIGPLAGNRNLAFGVKNIAEEVLQDKGFELAEQTDATHHVVIEIVYFDIEQVKSNIGVFHKDKNNTLIRMKGKLVVNGKTVRTAVAEEVSSEISTSTFIVDEGGGFNQQAASNALKKTCISLVEKLTSPTQTKK